VPPRTAARAWSATRVRLLRGCWEVSETPAVWVWNRIQVDRSFSARYRSVMSLYQMRRAARNLAISSKKSLCELKKKLSRGAKSSTRRPRAIACST
jgi:hypothetical protein